MKSIEITEELLFLFSPYLVNEYCYCTKLFWLHFHGLRIHEENEEIKQGKAEHEKITGESKNPWMKYDNVQDDVLVEYTKKKKDFTGKRMQLLIYLLRMGLYEGEIRHTVTKELFETVYVTNNEIFYLKKLLMEMNEISLLTTPPDIVKSDKCERCSFHDYCWVR